MAASVVIKSYLIIAVLIILATMADSYILKDPYVPSRYMRSLQRRYDDSLGKPLIYLPSEYRTPPSVPQTDDPMKPENEKLSEKVKKELNMELDARPLHNQEVLKQAIYSRLLVLLF